jgi:hypothetical protein
MTGAALDRLGEVFPVLMWNDAVPAQPLTLPARHTSVRGITKGRNRD